ncbi:MAG: MBL fold metallo-hydrolase [bacterium]|nr:MBL fold metallo-hydrolase [bacterium]
MRIKCWGSRGAIPVSGEEFLKYGGDTTCIEIRTKNDAAVIIDAGTGIRKLGNRLVTEKRNHIHLIFTHAHIDHLLGFPFFKPIYLKGTHIDTYGCPIAQRSIKDILAGSMTPPYFPISLESVNATVTYNEVCENSLEPFNVDSLRVSPILLSHPNQGIGYKFEEDGKSFVFLTDNELTFKHPGGLDYNDYLEFSKNCDLLIHDAEFTEEEYRKTRTWGHSVYNDALRLALEANAKQFGLFHHNQERSDEALDGIVDKCNQVVKEHGSQLECFALSAGGEIDLA